MTNTATATETPTRTPEELEVRLDDERRLLVEIWTSVGGRQLVSVKPEHVDWAGAWHLSHSGLLLAPGAARALASALERMSATIEEPTDGSEDS